MTKRLFRWWLQLLKKALWVHTCTFRSCFDHQNVCQLKCSRERKFIPFAHCAILLGFHLIHFCFQGHDLEKLADFDLQKVPNMQTLGSDIVRQIQHIMESQFSHSECGPALPEDQIQSIIVGVSYYTFTYNVFVFFFIYYDVASIHFDTQYHNMVYIF